MPFLLDLDVRREGSQCLLGGGRAGRHVNLLEQVIAFAIFCCTGTAGLGQFLREDNAELAVQCLTTLTELCQGPCEQNQVRSAVATADAGLLPETPTATLPCSIWLRRPGPDVCDGELRD